MTLGAPFVECRLGGRDHGRVPPPPAAHAAPAPPDRPAAPWWQLLLGAWIGVPAAVFVLAAVVTQGLSCSTNGLAVILPAAVAAAALSVSWAAHCRARRWQLILAVASGVAVSTVAAFAGWGWVALERCFTF